MDIILERWEDALKMYKILKREDKYEADGLTEAEKFVEREIANFQDWLESKECDLAKEILFETGGRILLGLSNKITIYSGKVYFGHEGFSSPEGEYHLSPKEAHEIFSKLSNKHKFSSNIVAHIQISINKIVEKIQKKANKRYA